MYNIFINIISSRRYIRLFFYIIHNSNSYYTNYIQYNISNKYFIFLIN